MALLNSFEIPLSLGFRLWASCSRSLNKGNPPSFTNLFIKSCLTVVIIMTPRVALDATSFSFLELLLREPYDRLFTMPIFLKRLPSIDNSYLIVDLTSEDSNVELEHHDTLVRRRDYVILSFSLVCVEEVS